MPAQAPVIAAAREARDRRARGARARLAAASRTRRSSVTGSNGKTTTVELIGHLHRTAGLPVVVVGNVGTALTSLVGSGAARGRRSWSARCRRSSSRTRCASPPTPACCSTSPRTTSTATARSTPTGRQARRCSPASRPARSPSRPTLSPPTTAAGGGRAVCSGTAPTRARLRRDRDGALWWDGERLMAHDEIRLRGAHNRLNAMAAAAVDARPRDGPGGGARGAGEVRRRRPPARGGRDPRRRALRQRLQGHERRLRDRGPRVVRGRRPPDPRRQRARPPTTRRSPRRWPSGPAPST